jgi:transcriptional regulator with XRE-family HTH domain
MTYDIKALRLAQSMSQKRLAHEAGIDVRTLRRIEGGVTVSPESYRAVCLALKIDPSVSLDETAPEPTATMAFTLASRLDVMAANSLAFSRTRRGKAIIVAAAAAVIVSAGMAVRDWWFRPNVSVTIAFDRSCDELGIWSKAFGAMDREFPDGYVIKDRIDGAKDCAYNFEAYYDAAGPRDPKMGKLVRNLEHAGTKTTVTYITDRKDVTPRTKDYWEKDKLITPATVQYFAKSSYEQVYRLNHDGLEGDIAYARGLFADQASFDGYVKSLKSSGNLDTISKFGLAISVLTTAPSLTEEGPDGIWTVKFRSKITYSGKMSVDQCLDATVRVKESNNELGILNVVSEPSTCRDRGP